MVTPVDERYIQLHPRSAELYATAKGIFPNGVTHDERRKDPFPIYVTHALGPHKWDADGHRIIDYKTGHGALILGHSHPDIVAAVTEQMSKGTHYSASTELEIRWGQRVCELLPCAEKVRFHNCGTEAVMMAFRMARAYTGKCKVVKFQEHFHGWSDYALAGGTGLGGIPQETLSTMIVLPPNDISIVEKTLKTSDDIAAVILEPTGSHMGEVPIRPSFLGELREVTRRHGVVLIFDEVVTGFRTSRGGAQAYYGVTPDLAALGKILGGGLPAGAVAGRADLIDMIEFRNDPQYDRVKRVSHPGTFNANPLSAAAGSKALELVATTPVNDTAEAMACRLKNGLNELLGRMEIPGCATGVDSIVFLRLGVEHECDKEICILSQEEMRIVKDPVRTAQLDLALLNHGVDIGLRALLGATHTEQDIDDTLEAVERALSEIREEGLV